MNDPDFPELFLVVQPARSRYTRRRAVIRPSSRDTSMAHLKVCRRCGNLWEPKPWQVKHHHDKECNDCTPMDPRWTQEYRTARAARMRIARGCCEDCGSKTKLTCHHIDGINSNHDIVNLRILCRRCHQQYTNVQRVARNLTQPRPKARRKRSKSLRLA